MMSDTADSSSSGVVQTCNQSKRKLSQLLSAEQEYVQCRVFAVLIFAVFHFFCSVDSVLKLGM